MGSMRMDGLIDEGWDCDSEEEHKERMDECNRYSLLVGLEYRFVLSMFYN